MKRVTTVFFLVVIALVIISGCTQSAPAPVPQPDQTQVPAVVTTPVDPAATARVSAPVETVTVIHYVYAEKAWKDSNRHIAFKAPENLKVTTWQMNSQEGTQGLEFQTDIVSNNLFYIRTFPISKNQDQEYRDTFRKWDPKPTESTVTINTIVYDRFESTKGGKTQVGYVARKSSANDLGYSSVLVFTADASHPLEKEDFEKVVASFGYFTIDQAATIQGEEIPQVR